MVVLLMWSSYSCPILLIQKGPSGSSLLEFGLIFEEGAFV